MHVTLTNVFLLLGRQRLTTWIGCMCKCVFKCSHLSPGVSHQGYGWSLALTSNKRKWDDSAPHLGTSFLHARVVSLPAHVAFAHLGLLRVSTQDSGAISVALFAINDIWQNTRRKIGSSSRCNDALIVQRSYSVWMNSCNTISLATRLTPNPSWCLL